MKNLCTNSVWLKEPTFINNTHPTNNFYQSVCSPTKITSHLTLKIKLHKQKIIQLSSKEDNWIKITNQN